MTKNEKYEEEKRKLIAKGLSSEELEKAIKKLCTSQVSKPPQASPMQVFTALTSPPLK